MTPVWLLPLFPLLSRLCLRVFYRIEVDGPLPDREGPLILVANHPNSLLDPACVVGFAGRPVRFLAKAPLFTQRDVGWLVRAAGSIPVHRRQDDPSRLGENDRTFRAAEDALLEGAAIGIFPEGLTHDEPSLSVLKTGTARIALGAARRLGGSFSIVPIGLSFPEKAIFRSTALVVRGVPVQWNDLAGSPPENVDCVHELTQRIEAGLRSVTLNLEGWEDREIVLGAEAIYAAETGAAPDHASRMGRLRIATDHLRRMRANDSTLHTRLGEGIRSHMSRLERLRLTPAELVAVDPQLGGRPLSGGLSRIAAATWSILAWIGGLVFHVPYRMTGWVASRFRPDATAVATHKLLAGILLFLTWHALLVAGVLLLAGPLPALLTALLLPALGSATLWMRDRSAEALRRARREWVLWRGREVLTTMRRRQIDLADELNRVLAASEGIPPADHTGGARRALRGDHPGT